MLLAGGCLAALALQMAGCAKLRKSAAMPALAPLLNYDATNAIPGHYLVILKEGSLSEPVEAAKTLAQSLGGTIGFTYTTALQGFSAELPPSALVAMRALPGVAYVEVDKRYSFQTSQPPDPATPPTPGLDRIDRRLLPLNGTYTYSETGAGVNVYVIDSGIRITHSEFGGRATADFSVSADFDDCRGHGTHVAAIIGGETFGVAKGVRLHSVKIAGPLGCSPDDANIVAGIDWVTANRVLPAVAVLSLGGPPPSPTLDNAVAYSIASGVTYVIAAGNYGDDACNSSPGRVPAAITVGAIDPKTDRRWVSSNVGRCVDVFAPGVDVLSAWNLSDTSTETKSGTSQAAPFVAGAAARFLEKVPMATPSEVWAALHRANNVSTTAGWSGVGDRGNTSPNELLYVHDSTTTLPGTVPSSDPTPPSTIWLQIDHPNKPLLNAFKDSADPPTHGTAGKTIRVTARSDDPDGGIMDIQIWMTEQRWSNGVTVGPSLAGAPVASDPRYAGVGEPARTTASVSYSFTLPTIPAGQNREYVFFARAENYYGGVLHSRGLAIDLP
jgi:subtilisin family serine protease